MGYNIIAGGGGGRGAGDIKAAILLLGSIRFSASKPNGSGNVRVTEVFISVYLRRVYSVNLIDIHQ